MSVLLAMGMWLFIALQTVASQASSSRRMAYPSVGQLLQRPQDISKVDVLATRITHWQCIVLFIVNNSKQLVIRLDLNLTTYGLQSIQMNLNETEKRVQNVLVYKNGSKVTYTAQLQSRSIGCAVKVGKNAGIFVAAQKVIDGLDYDTGEELATGLPERDPAAFEAYAKEVFNPKYNATQALLMYQKGKLVVEKYAPGFSKKHLLTIGNDGGHSLASMLPAIRQKEGKFDLDKLSHCPELKLLEKRARNMTGRNLMAWRIGSPLERTPYAGQKRPEWDYDVEKMLWCVADKANYAAVVPSSYAAGTVPSVWSPQHYASAGNVALLMRELRFTFPADSSGFSEYAAYPWKELFSKIGARSVVMEADASGTFVGQQNIWATGRDFLRLGALMAHRGRWNGKQILPAEYFARNLNNPYGPDKTFAEGWSSVAMPGMPRTIYLIGSLGYLLIVPDLEIVILDIQSHFAPKRIEKLVYQSYPAFLWRQTQAWKTTTTTSSTITAPTTIGASPSLAPKDSPTSTTSSTITTPVPAKNVNSGGPKESLTSTTSAAITTSDGNSGLHEALDSAPKYRLTKCVLAVLVLAFSAATQGGE